MTLRKSDLEGGFIQVKKKLWRGVIRTKEEKQVVWTCKHNHSRPEFNSRYEMEREVKRRDASSLLWKMETEMVWGVWETSALNCGRAAYRQWTPEHRNVKGYIGDRGSSELAIIQRPDMRCAHVDGTTYYGEVRLTGHGKRVLTVKAAGKDADKVKGSINLDLPPKKGLTIPTDVPTDEALKLVTAIWLLKGGIWGVMFQDHRVDMEAKGVLKEAVSQLLEDDRSKGGNGKGLALPDAYGTPTRKTSTPKRASKKLLSPQTEYEPSDTPRIEVRHKGGSRLYEVVDTRGVVLEQFHHRGKATKALADLKGPR